MYSELVTFGSVGKYICVLPILYKKALKPTCVQVAR